MAFKPSKPEEEHIWAEELRLRLQKLEEAQKSKTEAEKRRLKELHWMHCPKCGQQLTTEHYASVEIDVCPSCKGLWLDATELNTIVESEKKTGLLKRCIKILRGK
jgi:uncharacterized protein